MLEQRKVITLKDALKYMVDLEKQEKAGKSMLKIVQQC